MGPVWDFDGGFGYGWDEDTKEYFTSQSWIVERRNFAVPEFFTNMFANETFFAAYRARWETLKTGILEDAFTRLDTYVSQTAIALENDATRWPPIRRYDVEIQSLKTWLTERIGIYSSVLAQY